MTNSGNSDVTINLAAFLSCSKTNGPGNRAVIWVQGCPLRCEGCFNPEFQPFVTRSLISADILTERILSTKGIEGVTFSGGEPFAQAAALARIGKRLRDQGMNVVTFTGYPYDYLKDDCVPNAGLLLSVTDLLIAGPYQKQTPDNSPDSPALRKAFVFLTPCLRGRIDPSDDLHRTVEYQIHPDGTLVMTGFPEDSTQPGYPPARLSSLSR